MNKIPQITSSSTFIFPFLPFNVEFLIQGEKRGFLQTDFNQLKFHHLLPSPTRLHFHVPIITRCQRKVPNTFSSSSKFILKQQKLSFLRDKYLRHHILRTVKSVKDSAHPIQKHRNHGKDAVFLYTFKSLSTLS